MFIIFLYNAQRIDGSSPFSNELSGGKLMKRKKNVVLISIIVLFAIAFLCACAYIVIKGVLNSENRNEYNNIASSYAGELSQSQSSTEITAPTQIDIKKAENPVDFDSLIKQNPDIYAYFDNFCPTFTHY